MMCSLRCIVNLIFNTITSMGERNTVVSAYTLYRHLQQYSSHPSTCLLGSARLRVKCRTSNLEALGSRLTGSSVRFSWEGPWTRHFRAQEVHERVICRFDLTEVISHGHSINCMSNATIKKV